MVSPDLLILHRQGVAGKSISRPGPYKVLDGNNQPSLSIRSSKYEHPCSFSQIRLDGLAKKTPDTCILRRISRCLVRRFPSRPTPCILVRHRGCTDPVEPGIRCFTRNAHCRHHFASRVCCKFSINGAVALAPWPAEYCSTGSRASVLKWMSPWGWCWHQIPGRCRRSHRGQPSRHK